MDIIQPDITWLGGLTEARKVVAMAEAKGVLCIPHGSSVYSFRLLVARFLPIDCVSKDSEFFRRETLSFATPIPIPSRKSRQPIFRSHAQIPEPRPSQNHLQFAFRNCPVAEFINLSAKGDQIAPHF